MTRVEWNAQADDFPAKVNLVDRDGNVLSSIVLVLKDGKVVPEKGAKPAAGEGGG